MNAEEIWPPLKGRRNRHHYWEAIAYCLVHPASQWQNYLLQTQWRDKNGLVWC